jgi:hypothetical protein
VDAGSVDGGAPDAGPADGGPTDAGPPVRTRTIEVTTHASEVGAGHAVMLELDHAALRQALGSDPGGCDVVVESPLLGETLPHVLDPDSAWDRADTRIWFRLPSAQRSDAKVSYQLRVADGVCIPPARFDEVFIAGDDFEDGTLSASLTPSIHLGATIEETGGGLVFDMSDDQAEAAVVSATTPIPDDRRFSIHHRMRLDSVFGDDNSFNVKTIGIVQWPEQPGYAPNNVYGENRRQRIVINQGIDGKSWVYFFDANNDRWSWSDAGWVSGYSSWGTLPFGVDHRHVIDSDGDSFTLAILDGSGQEIIRTDPVDWSNVFVRQAPDGQDVSTGPFWFYWGEVYVTGEPLPDGGVTGGPYYTADLRSEWLIYRQAVAEEPTALLLD